MYKHKRQIQHYLESYTYDSDALLEQVVDCSVDGSRVLQIACDNINWDVGKHLHYAHDSRVVLRRHGWRLNARFTNRRDSVG